MSERLENAILKLADFCLCAGFAWILTISFAVIVQIGFFRDPYGGGYWFVVAFVVALVAGIAGVRFGIMGTIAGGGR